MRNNRKLVEEYRSAWEKYKLSLKELQTEADNGDRDRLEPLLLSVETGRLKYGAARDCLAAEILGVDFAAAAPATADLSHSRYGALSGKPQGTAENDWRRAERSVRHADATAG